MDEMRDSLGTGRWLCCYWQEQFELLDQLPRRAGLVTTGVLMLPPPFQDLAGVEGLWETLNDRLGTLIDFAEEEDLPPEALSVAASIALDLAARIEADDSRPHRVTVGQRLTPDPAPLVAELDRGELGRQMRMLAELWAEASRLQKPVTLSL